jgi:predicted nucleic-acid-binding protein
MIAVDTNILVRYFAEDDKAQTEKARRFLEEDSTEDTPAFVTLVTLVELIWVLNDTYKIGKEMQAEVVRQLLDTPKVIIERYDIVQSALELREGDIADRIIHLCGVDGGCTKTVTFDKKFARLKGVVLLA